MHEVRVEINMGGLGLRTARRAKVPGNIPHISSYSGCDHHTHQALNVYVVEQHAKLIILDLPITSCSREEMYQTTLLGTTSDEKLGGGLGTRLGDEGVSPPKWSVFNVLLAGHRI